MKIKKAQGSILAFSLVILAMMFAIVTAMTAVTIMNKKSAGSSQSSSQAFQVADVGAQEVIKRINSVLKKSKNKLSDAFPGTECSVVSGAATVKGGMSAGMTYDATFYKKDSATPIDTCDEIVTTIKDIKSVGTYKNTVRAVSVGVSAPDPSTKLLLHADGVDGSTNFLDSSSSNKTVTAKQGAKISAGQKVFGSGSAFFDGNNDHLVVADSSDWDFGTGDFTIDFWEKNIDSGRRQHAFSFGATNSANLDFGFDDPNACPGGGVVGLWVYWNSGGTNGICSSGLSKAYTNGAWHHIALVRKLNKFKLFVDGNLVGSKDYIGAINLSSNKNFIGASTENKYYWKGYLDEIRVSKGIARWDANFTLPASPY